MTRRLTIIFFSLLCLVTVKAAPDEPLYPDTPGSTAELSILTCQPGDRLYSKFGHTALHLVDTVLGADYVFNYGVFNFYAPNFIPLFIAGKANYMLDVEPTDFFYMTSYDVGRYNIYEQTLNLTTEQKNAILFALMLNLQPENVEYRYNFVFDNCATRPYRLIKNSLHQTLSAPQFEQRKDTYRNLIRYYSGQYTWAGYAINLAFGRDADVIMKPTSRLFLPEQLMDFLEEATLEDGTPLVTNNSHVGRFEPQQGHFLTSPQLVEILILLLAIGLGIANLKRGKKSWWFSSVIMLIMGLLGIVIAYLPLSSHPLVHHNANLFFLNPLWLVPAIMTWSKRGRKILQHPKAQILILAYFLVAFTYIAFSGQQEVFVIIPSALLLYLLLTPNNLKGTNK